MNKKIVALFAMILLILQAPVVFADDDKKIDRYGQFINFDYEGKIKSDEQLKATVKTEKEYYDSISQPKNWDAYGGLANSGKELGLSATGFFHCEQLEDGKWVMVDPDGNLFFSTGINGIGYLHETYTVVTGRENIYEWLPPFTDPKFQNSYLDGNSSNFSFYMANWVKKYGKPFDSRAYASEAVARSRKWGFNTAGGWSSGYVTAENMPTVAFLPMPANTYIKSAAGNNARIYDVFSKDWNKTVEANLKDSLIAKKDEKLIIGYFIDNELMLPRLREIVPGAKASELGTKKKLVEVLKDKYEDIAAFNEAWKTKYNNFSDIEEAADLSIKTDAAADDFNEFIEIYMDYFYKTVSEIVRKYDPNHMIIGDRLASNTHELNIIACKTAGKYIDVISYNYYTYALDMEKIKEMSDIADKPLMMTEFCYGEPTRGLVSSPRILKNGEEKGLGYRNYVENVAASGVVVGTHWFTYLDQSATGRYFEGLNGEGYAIGLFDVADQPYLSVVNSMKETNDNIYDIVLGKKQPYNFTRFPAERGSNPPMHIPQTKIPVVVDGILDENWPESKVYLLGDANRVLGIYEMNMEAEFRFAWDKDNLYMFADVKDITPMTNERKGGDVWNGDAIELFIGPDKDKLKRGGELAAKDSQLLVGAGPEDGPQEYGWANNRPDQPAVSTFAKRNSADNGYTMELAIPFKDLYIDDAGVNREFRFDFCFDNGTKDQRRVSQFVWNGSDSNSKDRSKWGTVILVDKYSEKLEEEYNETENSGNTDIEESENAEEPTEEMIAGFRDLADVSWAVDSISDLVDKGIILGVGDNLFAPNDNITRAAFLKIIMPTLNLMDESASVDFSDVEKDHWGYPFIASAYKKRVADGNEYGSFEPDEEVTRQEMAVLVYRALNAAKIKLKRNYDILDFDDCYEIDPYARVAVKILQQAEVIEGNGNNFSPKDKTTRAEAAKIICSLLSLK